MIAILIIISLILTLALYCCCVSAGRAEKRERGKIKMTNFEKIKAMTVEEIAKFLAAIVYKCWTGECFSCPLEKCDECCEKDALVYFLKSEVLEDE